MPVLTIQDIARCCHEANRVLCEAIGDFSQIPWKEARNWQRESAVAGVNYFLKNPSCSPSDQHDAWSNDKLADGWVYGPVKDADAKTHPCLVPYGDLPIEQQAKDSLFRGVCSALVPLLSV